MPRSERSSERFDFDGVSERGARAVRLDVIDLGRCDAGVFESLADQRLLRRAIRHREAAAAAVLVDRGSGNDRKNSVAACARVRQSPECHDAAAFGSHEAIGGGIECLAAPVPRHHPPLGEQPTRGRLQDDVHAAGEGERAIAGIEASAGQMHGHERRGAGGVEGHARPLEPQYKGQSARGRI